MRRTTSRARSRLPDAGRTVAFFASQANADGGFKDRGGRSDLYYTVFAVESLAALGQPAPPKLDNFLAKFIADTPTGPAAGQARFDSLDFVHLTCLARCIGEAAPPELANRILHRLETFRTPDGGYSQWPGSNVGTTYGCILAVGTYQDLTPVPSHDSPTLSSSDGNAESRLVGTQGSRWPGTFLPPDPDRLLDCIRSLRTGDGGYVNEPGQSAGLTPATAAAITVQIELGQPADPAAIDWLLARHSPAGGFAALPGLPLADLLSTATALHALSRAGADISRIGQACERFVLDLWDDGAFRGHALDDVRDCEYTFYGLLAMGELDS